MISPQLSSLSWRSSLSIQWLMWLIVFRHSVATSSNPVWWAFFVNWLRLFDAPVIALNALSCCSVNLGTIFLITALLRTHSDLLMPAVSAFCKTLLCSCSSKRTLILIRFLFSSVGLPPLFLVSFMMFFFCCDHRELIGFGVTKTQPCSLPIR